MVACLLDLQLPMHSVHIATKVVSLNTALRRGVLDTTLCDNVCQWLATYPWFSLGTPASCTNTIDNHDIAEILLKVALNTMALTF